MVYFTGDIHGEEGRFFGPAAEWEKKLAAGDILIICGDAGLVFTGMDYENALLDRLAEKPYVICYCDGNHENFSLLRTYPTVKLFEGRAHKIRDNIFHLLRGESYLIEGKRYFVFGGGYSRDRALRILGLSYWEEELPSEKDYHAATCTLKELGYKMDYIITHTAPGEVIPFLGKRADPHEREFNQFLDWIRETCTFQKWFFGHFHTDKAFKVRDQQFRALRFDVVTAEENAE